LTGSPLFIHTYYRRAISADLIDSTFCLSFAAERGCRVRDRRWVLLVPTAAAMIWIAAAGAQVQPGSHSQAAPARQSTPSMGSALSPTPVPGPLYDPSPPRRPSGGSRPGGVSYRYDALGRIIEIVRIPAQ
jgi:hypothetical protein